MASLSQIEPEAVPARPRRSDGHPDEHHDLTEEVHEAVERTLFANGRATLTSWSWNILKKLKSSSNEAPGVQKDGDRALLIAEGGGTVRQVVDLNALLWIVAGGAASIPPTCRRAHLRHQRRSTHALSR